MCSISGPQIMLRGYIFDTNFLYRMFVALLISKPSKNSVSVTILLSCNSKGLILDFHLNRKRNKCWLAACSCDLFTCQYIWSYWTLLDWSHNFAAYVINTAGLEDIGCRKYFDKLLVGFKQKILKIALESLRNKFQREFFNGSYRLGSLVSVRQN